MRTLGLFTPYPLDPGGGERYLLSVAEAFRQDLQVFLVTPTSQPAARLEKLGQDLDVQIDHVVPITLEESAARAPFDIAVVMGNEALPPVRGIGRKNVYLCQFPFPLENGDITERFPFWSDYDNVVVYSDYTKSHLTRAWKDISAPARPICVIHPPVRPIDAPPGAILTPGSILSVGRFFSGGHSKRQDLLIAAFEALGEGDFSLHLAGALHDHDNSQEMYSRCQMLAKGLPVTFWPNTTRSDLGRLYAESACYWHGAGLEADREREPERFEHFGITIVEAMASGCIPFVPDHGGPAAIVTSGKNGWLYHTPEELTQLTRRFFGNAESTVFRRMRSAARERAHEFYFDVFAKNWKTLFGKDEG